MVVLIGFVVVGIRIRGGAWLGRLCGDLHVEVEAVAESVVVVMNMKNPMCLVVVRMLKVDVRSEVPISSYI